MALSEARKRANAKWNKANTKSAACTLTLKEHAAFKAYAAARGKTISGQLLEYVRGCIAPDGREISPTSSTALLQLVSNTLRPTPSWRPISPCGTSGAASIRVSTVVAVSTERKFGKLVKFSYFYENFGIMQPEAGDSCVPVWLGNDTKH